MFCRKSLLFLRQIINYNFTQSANYKIIAKIKKGKRGSLFFIEDFLTFGTSKTLAKALIAKISSSVIQAAKEIGKAKPYEHEIQTKY